MTANIANQRRNLPLFATPENVSGGTYIVTGANTGLGFEAAKHMVTLGAEKVILAVRNVASGETAKTTIEQDTGKTGVAEVWPLDLSSYDSVKTFAKRAVTELDRIDALIENAGVAMAARHFAEGHLLPVTVNVLSTLLLAVLLLPKMSEDAKKFGITPHVAFISSGAGFDVKDDFLKISDDPLNKIDSDDSISLKSYPLSKLLESLAVRQLATLVPVDRTGVVLNYVCPGLCKTDLSRNAPPAFRENLKKQHEQFGRTAEDGSRTLLHGVVAGKGSHGRLLDSCEIADEKLPGWISEEEGKRAQERLWEVIAKELETTEPGSVDKVLKL